MSDVRGIGDVVVGSMSSYAAESEWQADEIELTVDGGPPFDVPRMDWLILLGALSAHERIRRRTAAIDAGARYAFSGSRC